MADVTMGAGWRALLLGVAVGLSGCLVNRYAPAPPLPDYGAVGEFRLKERGGRPVTPADLAGNVWVASFVFTRCTGPCPQVTGTMARLQAETKDRPEVRLVTFTVDPEHDQPEELRKYAEHFGADPERWLFLTGEEKEIHRVIRDGFHLGVEAKQGAERTPGNEVEHSTRLALVDRRGHVRGYFDGRQVDDEGRPVSDVPRVKEALAALLAEGP